MTLGRKNKRKVRIFAVCCIFRNYNSKALQSKVNPPIQIVCRGCCKRSFAFGVALCRALETFSISTASTRTNDNNCWHCRTGRMILNAILGGDRWGGRGRECSWFCGISWWALLSIEDFSILTARELRYVFNIPKVPLAKSAKHNTIPGRLDGCCCVLDEFMCDSCFVEEQREEIDRLFQYFSINWFLAEFISPGFTIRIKLIKEQIISMVPDWIIQLGLFCRFSWQFSDVITNCLCVMMSHILFTSSKQCRNKLIEIVSILINCDPMIFHNNAIILLQIPPR